MKNIIKILMVVLGTLIGAGFASGKEIYIFFNKYGILGALGIIISTTILCLIIYLVLKITKQNEVNNYSDMLEIINPKYPIINKIIIIIVNGFLLVSFFIMTSAFSAYLNQEFQISNYIASIVFVIFCYIILRKSIQGIININNILVPLLLIFILYLGIKNISMIEFDNTKFIINSNSKGFLISSILYANYNSIILIPILINLKNNIKKEKDVILITIISVVSISILCFTIYSLLLNNDELIQRLELPLVEITKSKLYSFIIIVSIFTSALSTGYSFLKNVSKNEKAYKNNLICISIIAIIVSKIGFSNLVKILYPLFGILGLLQFCFLIKFIPKLKKPLEKKSKN